MTDQHQVYLSLGTNLGDKEQNIKQAIRHIGLKIGPVTHISSLLTTQPWGFTSSNLFINAAIKCTTRLTPHQVLQQTQEIERMMGRTQKSQNAQYKDRIIDIDILIYDDLQLQTPELTIPHPLMKQRDFVMKPLMEIYEK